MSLENAISKAHTLWLKTLLKEKLPDLPSEANKEVYTDWFNSIIAAFEARQLFEYTQQKNPLSQVCNAIRVINPNHPALEVVKFEKHTWREINNASADMLGDRTTKFIPNPELIVSRAENLLKSQDWADIAAGLVIVSGRRSTEILKTAVFDYKTKYSVLFSGSLKRPDDEVKCVYEIPTLVEAELVINKLASLRKDLGEQVDNLTVKETSNNFSRKVSSICNKHFADVVPKRKGRNKLSAHVFRAVYSTISSHWFCPPKSIENEYHAHVQGHFEPISLNDPTLRRSIAAGRNYSDYKISDGSKLGIKLNQPGVSVIEPFRQDYQLPIPSSPKITNKKPVQSSLFIRNYMSESVTIPRYLISRLNLLSEKLGMNQQDTLDALFDWTETSLSLSEILELDNLKPNVLYRKVEELQQLSAKIPNSAQDLQPPMNANGTITLNIHSFDDLCSTIRSLTEMANRSSSVSTSEPEIPKAPPQNHTAPSQLTTEAKTTQITQTNRKKRKASSRTFEAEAHINQTIDQIFEFNESKDLPHEDKIRIGIGLLRTLTGRNDDISRRILKSRESEIDAHHQKHNLKARHNGISDIPPEQRITSISK